MAEILGIIGSVGTIAGEGLRLSNALYSFAQKAKHAEQDMKHISKEIKNTAVILRQLESILAQESRGSSLSCFG